jgi:hypothetical protein
MVPEGLAWVVVGETVFPVVSSSSTSRLVVLLPPVEVTLGEGAGMSTLLSVKIAQVDEI